ncbi:hypothetical protein AAFX91_08270 [Bradyrhizobium sp. 31Argb]|uniref:hypothetical protein n=1 Tax=Bradyrhizobium sp. 31Argb TaxID=3141247 RepID=UPI0037499965
MNRYTPEQAAESIAEARSTLDRVDQMRAGRSSISEAMESLYTNPGAVQTSAAGFEARSEDAGLKWRREMTELEEQRAAERAQAQREEQREREARERRISVSSLEQRITEVETELLDAVRACSTLAEAYEHELARRSVEVAELKTAQARLEKNIAELELRLVTSGKVLDLPSRLVQ